MFALLDAAGDDDHRWIGALVTFLYFGSGAVAVLRWGLLSYAVAVFVSGLLMDLPATLDTSAWYLGNMAVPVLITVALASWALHTSMGGRPWTTDRAGQARPTG
jgi:hypothetical protein